jgi:hypothetical protein
VTLRFVSWCIVGVALAFALQSVVEVRARRRVERQRQQWRAHRGRISSLRCPASGRLGVVVIEDTLTCCPECGECWAGSDPTVPEHQARSRRA